MSETEYQVFEHFACDLLLHSLHFKMLLLETYKPIPLTEKASTVLALFADVHCDLFRRIFARSDKEVLQTDEHFLRFALPRCLNLIDVDRYFESILLVASFLQELVTFLRDNRVCFRFYFTAYKCLAAVYERALKDSFDSKGGWNGLEKYLDAVISAYEPPKKEEEKPKDGDICVCEKAIKLIENCDNIPDDFDLNEYEISLVKDDDVKKVQESLVYNEADEDPLLLSWPQEQISSIKEATLTESQSSNDSIVEEDINMASQCSDINTERDMAVSPSSDSNTEMDIEISSVSSSDSNIGKAMEGSSTASIDPNTGKAVEGSSVPSSDPSIGKAVEGSTAASSDPNTGKAVEGSTAASSDPNIGKAMEGSSVPSSDPNIGKGMEGSIAASSDPKIGKAVEGPSSEEVKCSEYHSILRKCLPKVEAKPECLMLSNEFWEKIKSRRCPCCGIKCYKFSYELFLKELQWALLIEDEE